LTYFVSADFARFRAAILDLIAVRRSRLDALALPDPGLEAELEDLEAEYVAMMDKTSPADQEVIGEFYREALEVFGSNEELFQQYPDVAGLLMALRFEGAREQIRGLVKLLNGTG